MTNPGILADFDGIQPARILVRKEKEYRWGVSKGLVVIYLSFMSTIKLLSMITLGEVSRYLVDASQGWELHGDGRIIESIDALKRSLVALGFKVAAEAAAGLEQFKAEMERHATEATLSEEEEHRLRSEMTQLRFTITAEAKTLEAYVLTEHRLDAKKLIESPKSFLSADTFYRLPEIARSDFREAGKCIAFERPTAAAFHLLRAVEDTLRSYYGTFVKRGRMDKPLWGPIISVYFYGVTHSREEGLAVRRLKPKAQNRAALVTSIEFSDNHRAAAIIADGKFHGHRVTVPLRCAPWATALNWK